MGNNVMNQVLGGRLDLPEEGMARLDEVVNLEGQGNCF